jgi:hypothetical protein
MAGVKPAGAMKTPSGKFAFVILTVIVMLAVGSCCIFELVDNQKGFLVIGTKTTYVEWKQPDFDNALAKICEHGGFYDLKVLVNVRDKPIDPYKPCNRSVNIRTVKITKSKLADNTAAQESAANDPNAMHRIASAYPGDIIKVLQALKP